MNREYDIGETNADKKGKMGSSTDMQVKTNQGSVVVFYQ